MTTEERLRAAMAVLSEVIADTRVPNGLRKLATAVVQEYQDHRKESRKPDPISTQPIEGSA